MLYAPLSIKPPPVNWSPLATLGLSATVGSYIGTKRIDEEAGMALILFATIFLVVGLILKKNKGTIILSASIFLLFMGKSAVVTHRANEPWPPTIHGELVNLQLVLTSDPIVIPKTTGAMAQFDHMETTTRFTARVPLKQQQANIKVTCNEHPNILAGDEITATGWIHLPNKNNKVAVFYITNIKTIVKTKENPMTIQKNIRNNLLLGLHDETKTLARALFFGVRDSGWKEVSTTFRRAGMAHILAISGMHVAILAMFICAIIRKIPLQRSVSTVLIVSATCFLVSAVETRAPVTRALTMVVAYLLLQFFLLRCKPLSLIAISALGILVYSPAAAGTMGFQLSFIVVSSILVLYPRLVWCTLGPEDTNATSANMLKRRLSSMWITGACAWIISAPVLAHVFGTISPIGLVSSIPSIFMLTVALFVGIIKTTATFIFGTNIVFVTTLFAYVLSKFIVIAKDFGGAPISHIEGVFISWLLSIVLVFLIFLITFSVRKKKTAWAISLLTLSVWAITCGTNKNNTTITTVRVGHGACHVIQNMGETMVIDAGSRNNLDVGKNTIVPMLHKLGVKQIKTLVITHSDIDHLCGIIDISQKFQIKKIIAATQTMRHKTAPMSAVLGRLAKQHVPVLEKHAGWNEKIGSAKITMLSPNKYEKYRSANATSIVMLLETCNRKVLFTGDIDEKKITELMPILPRRLDVMELPHHGQWSKESQNMINTTAPKVVIQSTNLARHTKDKWFIPHQTERFVTAIDGTITIKIEPSGSVLVTGSRLPATMPQCVFFKQ